MVHRSTLFFSGFLCIPSDFTFCGMIGANRNQSLKTYVRLKKSKNLQFPANAHEMEDAQVDDRVLQATTDRNKGTQTTTMTLQVDLGLLRAARTAWSEKTDLVKIEPESQPRVG